jgi:CO dehydrogenase nickel-insertion accessory protein CooC1
MPSNELASSDVILTLGNKKGGVGKSTSAVYLACLLARTGRTLIVDADPQGVCVPGSGVVPEVACRVLDDEGGHRATVSETGLGNSQKDTMHDGLGPC